MRLHAAAFVVGVAVFSGCGDPPGDPPGDGSLRINVSNLALRASFTELDLHITKVELFYGAVPPASDQDCDAPGQTVIASPPIAVVVDLTQVGDSFVGAFAAPPGHISEIRLVSDNTHGVELALTRRAHLSTHCPGGDDTSGLIRLVPLPGQSIDIAAGDTTQIEVQLDPTRDIVVDGQGGDYGQLNGPNHVPGDSCSTGGPCGKPFKLASDYGVLAFIVSGAKDWRALMTNTPLPHTGCFKAFYPDTVWHEVPCTTAPLVPQNVGGGGTNDFTARTTGLLSMAVGSFDSVTGLMTSESSSTGGAAAFALQLNANTFKTPVCTTAGCKGWQQFVYDGRGQVYIQYWLLVVSGNCPDGWQTSSDGNCVRNSDTVSALVQAPANLGQMSVVGKTVANGSDTIIVSTTGGDLSAVGADSVLGLQAAWTDAEFNVVGDGNSSTASLNAGTTIVVRTAITDGTPNAPACVMAGTTGEMNSLNLLSPCCTVSGTEPAIVFTESNVSSATVTCPAGVCTAAPKILVNTTANNGANCFGTSNDYDFGPTNCDPGFQLGVCSAVLVTSQDGSTCSATPIGGCRCRVHVTTPADCIKGASCAVLVTEQPTSSPAPQIVISSGAHNGSDCFGTSHDYDFAATCDSGFQLGGCFATLITDPNGSTCTATPIGGCGCRLHVETPSDCVKSATCSIVATEVPTGWGASCPSLVRF
jgi:hypothetical protein